jgi:hypothetical protein
VRDLRTGGILSRVIRPSGGSEVTDVVLMSDGAAAWISSDEDGTAVGRIAPGGEPQTIDSARDIDPRSLVLGGDGTIYWRRGDTVLSAPLRG